MHSFCQTPHVGLKCSKGPLKIVGSLSYRFFKLYNLSCIVPKRVAALDYKAAPHNAPLLVATED